MHFRIITILILIILALATSLARASQYPKLKAWAPLPNRTIIARVEGDPPNEKRVYVILNICPCVGGEQGWVLKTEEKKPTCYSIGEQIAVMRDGAFHSFVEKTFKEK